MAKKVIRDAVHRGVEELRVWKCSIHYTNVTQVVLYFPFCVKKSNSSKLITVFRPRTSPSSIHKLLTVRFVRCEGKITLIYSICFMTGGLRSQIWSFFVLFKFRVSNTKALKTGDNVLLKYNWRFVDFEISFLSFSCVKRDSY